MKTLTYSQKFALSILLCGMMLNAQSATTDLSNAPLITSPTSSVQPNLFLMLDDSGSMAWDYMPDNAGNFGYGTYGAASGQCNGVFYDPNITYDPPVTSTGTSYANSSFTGAWNNGYNTGGGATNLSTSFQPTGGTAAPAYYYNYTGAQTTEKLKDYYNTNSAFYQECNSAVGSSPGLGKFTKAVVSSTSGPGSTDERTNFANWWSYYHTRILMVKTAAGKAFSYLDTSVRVGYASINNNTGTDILALNTFDAAQKAAWFTKLYAATPSNSTPLLQALSDAGLMYAHKLPSTNATNALTSSIPDPIQYSCQQNYTILTTDGFWNGNSGVQLDNSTAVGNQDYFEPRPMYDGSNVVQTTTTPYTTVQTRQNITSGAVTTNTWSKTTTAIGAACATAKVPPANTVSTLTDNSRDVRVGLSNVNPDGTTRCKQLGTGTGAGTAWLCRSGSSAVAVSASQVTDSNGVTWYLVSSASALGTSCLNDNTAWGNSYVNTKGACPSTNTGAGQNVTLTPYTQSETISGITTTSVNAYTANQSTTQTTTNGVVGPVSSLTPATPTYIFTNNISTTNTGTPTDTFGAWNTGTTSTTCVLTAALPAAGTTTAAITATSTTSGTVVTTVLSTVGPTAGTPNTTGTSSGGTSNTLADVAEYYYITDLRTAALGNNLSAASGAVNGTDISANNVPTSGLDAAAHQHMTTFTLGLGARGRMVFDPGYASATSGDFYAVKQGSTANGTTVCSWQANGSCNWPTPGANQIENIDDLWHAAVNGRGTYFSASNPTGLATALSSALASVKARTGSTAAATTSNAFVTQGDNFLFRSTYVSQKWTGELMRQQLDINTGAILTAIDWSAQAALDANSSRNIKFFDASSANKLSAFTLANLTTAGLDIYFNTAYISTLSQLCSTGATCMAKWTASTYYVPGNVYLNGTTWYRVNTAYTSGGTFGTTDTNNSSVVNGPAGVNLVNYLRGDRTYEGASTDTDNGQYYRQRDHVLGDIVDSETTYVRGALTPHFTDPGYSAYISAMADRQSMVYVGANDGMLHAFYADSDMMDSTTGHVVASGGVNVTGGAEAWAFIPTKVIPNLYKLADKNYTNQHLYFVDGSPATADICVSNCTNVSTAVWKTILVGSLGLGGKGYYALDITNPAAPKALWEFTDANMGYTYGNPKIVKLKTGQWVVLMSSGYNNTSGDGQGYLYVVDAYTGAPATSVNSTGIIGTGVGSVGTPSGLAHIDAPLAAPGFDSTAFAVYGGDMSGNLWRFDINGDKGATGYEAQLLATLMDAGGNAQPITTQPLLSYVGNTLVVFVGTGRYLGSSDLSDTSQQSLYAIKDTFPTGTTASIAIEGNPRASGNFVQQTQTITTCPVGAPASVCTSGQSVITSSNLAVDFTVKSGWFFDFARAGERLNTDLAILSGTLILNSNVPNASSCSVGGDSYQYQLDYSTGGPANVSTMGVTGVKLGNELYTRPVVATLADGSSVIYSQGSGGRLPTSGKVVDHGAGGGGGGGGGPGNNGTPNLPATRQSWRILSQ